MGRKAVSILFYGISVVLTGLLLVAAVLCRYASSVSPGRGGFWATLALLMPVVLLANVVALVWWTVRRKWIVLLMPLVALVLNLGYISAMVQLPDFKDSGDPHDIRIATLNVNGFRRLGSMPATARAIAGMMNREQVDVLCLQEFMDSREFPADSIGKVFAPRMPYFLHEGSAALVSRYPVLDHKYVRFCRYEQRLPACRPARRRRYGAALRCPPPDFGHCPAQAPVPEGLRPRRPRRANLGRTGTQQ
ncbi:MAG: endonuclease/exonuclease/phosphatase family protein [Alistipes onderdonkii]